MVIYNGQLRSDSDRRTRAQREKIPTALVRGMFVLVLVCLCLVAFARLTGRPVESRYPDLPVVGQRQIVLTGDTTGAARVTTPAGALIADLDATKGGFVAGMARVMQRERLKRDTDPAAPLALALVRYSDGRLSLEDPLTGLKIALVGFGASNTDTFAQLLK